MGHSEMGLAVAGLKDNEIKQRVARLATGDWSDFPPAERQAFQFAYKLTFKEGVSAATPGAVGLVILGACIGSLSALVQGVFQPASVKVLRGWQEGREYPLEKPESLLGRDEHADIALFRDMKVEKRHALIRRDGRRYVLRNNRAPADFTRVNDAPVAGDCELHDGDRIQLGNVLLRFQLRAAQARRPRART